MKYYITKHCRDRYIERISTLDNITDVLNDIYKGSDITNSLFDKYPRYILYLYERYNSCNVKIIQNGNNTYIARKRVGTINIYDVVTCYKDSNFDSFGNTSLNRQEIFIRISILKKKLKA